MRWQRLGDLVVVLKSVPEVRRLRVLLLLRLCLGLGVAYPKLMVVVAVVSEVAWVGECPQ